ncbi:hypothetical protein BT96DRAFT_922571 [Gymnopus androsaceus JB14]|uniref:Uncharacterized protein n=1 Tax=Gymnopus androsaceus JB14 TaxID=1447944 RepID=A0A6A4HDQ8_9AGAR|nr:hypothetical protein BT96DRAFT_922571 [Gymnopus androsaceus JB14]
MAHLNRSAKSGNEWTLNELRAYNITICLQSSDSFFGYTPNEISNAIDPDFLTATLPPNENLADDTYRLLQYLGLATRVNSGQESAIHDFAKELLRLLGFEERETLLRSRYAIPFLICGDDRRSAQADLCIVQGNTRMIRLVIQEDKTTISANPEPKLIAGAIAAFQYNNAARSRAGLDPLDSMTILRSVLVPSSTKFPSLGS